MRDFQFRLLSLRNLSFSLSQLSCSFHPSRNLIHIYISFGGIIYILLSRRSILTLMAKTLTLLEDALFFLFYFCPDFVSFLEVWHWRVYFLCGCTMQRMNRKLFRRLIRCIRTPFEFLNFFFDEFYSKTLTTFSKCSYFFFKRFEISYYKSEFKNGKFKVIIWKINRGKSIPKNLIDLPYFYSNVIVNSFFASRQA